MNKFHIILTCFLALCACTSSRLAPGSPTENPADHYAGTTAIETQQGMASWYSIKTNHGTRTASGRPLDNEDYTAAHKNWPMGSKVRVTNLRNGRSEILTISDRGPYIKGRIIDVTVGSAKRLGFFDHGLIQTKVELLERGDWKYQH